MPDAPLTRSWLSSEWRFVVSVVTPIVAVMVTWFALQTRVELIGQKVDIMEGNHLTHMQESMEKMADALERLTVSETETRTMLDQHLKQ